MAPTGFIHTNATRQDQKISGVGATEEQVDMQATLGQRIDKIGTKLEDLAGTGQIDSEGG